MVFPKEGRAEDARKINKAGQRLDAAAVAAVAIFPALALAPINTSLVTKQLEPKGAFNSP